MEFKFRATDGQASVCHTQSSNFTYFTEQAIQAGYQNNNFGRAHEFFRNPTDMREEIQREIEKERIREEIIAEEIARRRVLEAEVRRELMIEEEMGLRRADGFSLLSHRFEPRLSIFHQSQGRSFEERIAMSLEERYGQPSRGEIGGFEMAPFQHRVEPKISEFKPLPEVSKEKVILLGKPDINVSGVKRKAVTPPAAGASELLSIGSKKKLKGEWSCAICQVSATSEWALNEHLGGKKHQAKEAVLRGQKTGTNLGLGVFPKKNVKLAEITSSSTSEQRVKIERKLPLLKNNSSAENWNKKGKPFLHVKNDADGSKKKDVKTGDYNNKEKKFRFWCEMCKVGTFSEKVMNNHKRGKKHVARLQGLNVNGRAALVTRKEKDLEEVAEEDTRVASEEFEARGHEEFEAEVADSGSA